jgi:hypothetical protein
MELLEMMQFRSAVLLVVVSLVSLAGGAWMAGSYILEESRLAADNQLGDLLLGSSDSPSNVR